MTFNKNIVALAKVNTLFRQVLATGKELQLSVMSIPAGDEISEGLSPADIALVFIEGEGEVIVSGERTSVAADHLIFVPAGAMHTVLNRGSVELKLYVISAPPEFRPGTTHTTKAEADAAHEAL